MTKYKAAGPYAPKQRSLYDTALYSGRCSGCFSHGGRNFDDLQQPEQQRGSKDSVFRDAALSGRYTQTSSEICTAGGPAVVQNRYSPGRGRKYSGSMAFMCFAQVDDSYLLLWNAGFRN